MIDNKQSELKEIKLLGRILILDLLDLLKKYSNKHHPLGQQKIIKILEKNYGYKDVRRQTIKDNIERMIDHYELNDRLVRLAAEDNYFDNDIEDIDETKRRITNIYYQHKLSDSELLLIIDSILFSNQIPVERRKKLIEKLEGLASKHFNSRKSNIASIADSNRQSENSKDKMLFDNIREMDKAIIEAKQISFNYIAYKVIGNQISIEGRKNSKGEERKYIVNPYYMAVSNGRYYLICNNDKYKNISSYRVDRIINIKILDKKESR